ncbi:MAG TPA: ABC transporter ATP-binding protein [Spongiibacteraceae bacterium]|nr:ABC transporter ATP-binding protein [Spongiibacteraceae bacterium]
MTSLLELRGLKVAIHTSHGEVQAVRGVDLCLSAGETLALVGESGCGKSMTAMSIAGLLPNNATIVDGDVLFEGVRLNDCTEREWSRMRGARIGFVFQNPMSSFNPVMRIGDQIAEVLVAHRALSAQTAQQRAVQLLDRMRIANATARARQYPFEMSGGMLQRAMIAMAVACEPQLLIADEPTTALDVTVQKEVLQLVAELQRDSGMACLLITHDLGIVEQMADRVAVMYAGEIIEQGPVDTLFHSTAHPYTRGLRAALPTAARGELMAIPGTPPDLSQHWRGCSFSPRCTQAMKICLTEQPPAFAIDDKHSARCWLLHSRCKRRCASNQSSSCDE